MSSEAQEPRHWPFTKDAGADGPVTSFRAAPERKDARASTKAMKTREHARLNRLIVGGRAHAKQHGLS